MNQTPVDEPKAYVHQAYPAWRYHRDHAPRKVQNPAEEAALGFGWIDSPSKVHEPWVGIDAPDPAVCAQCGQPMPAVVAVAPAVPAAPAGPRTEADLEEEAKRTQFEMSVDGIVAALIGVTDPALLTRIRVREEGNPKHPGGRKGILDAIDRKVKVVETPTGELVGP